MLRWKPSTLWTVQVWIGSDFVHGNGQARHSVCSEILPSYMSRPSVKALSALKHLASYLEGTPDDGILLGSTEEGKMVSDF